MLYYFQLKIQNFEWPDLCFDFKISDLTEKIIDGEMLPNDWESRKVINVLMKFIRCEEDYTNVCSFRVLSVGIKTF